MLILGINEHVLTIIHQTAFGGLGAVHARPRAGFDRVVVKGRQRNQNGVLDKTGSSGKSLRTTTEAK